MPAAAIWEHTGGRAISSGNAFRINRALRDGRLASARGWPTLAELKPRWLFKVGKNKWGWCLNYSLSMITIRTGLYFSATTACLAFASSGRADADPSQVLTRTA